MSSKDVEITTKDAGTPTRSSNNSKYDDDDDDGDDSIKRAASAIRSEADFVLILASAGFSADAGRSTYETMPEEYRELCNPL